jgi:peptidyl-prolyl cis-trans isomerase C
VAINRGAPGEFDERANPQTQSGEGPDRPDLINPDDETRSAYGGIIRREDVERASMPKLDDDLRDGDARDDLVDDDSEVEADADDARDDGDERRRPPLALLIGGALLVIILAVGAGVYFTRPTTADLNQVVAKVGDTNITRGEFERMYSQVFDPQESMNRLIQIELVVQAAKQEGVTIDQAQVDDQINEFRSQVGGDEAQFLEALKQFNLGSEAEMRRLLENQQYIDAMILKHTTVEQAKSSHILLQAQTPEDVEKRKGEAETLLAQVQNGGDFAALAREKSDDPGSKEKGGDLGWAPRGAFVPPFDKAIFEEMKPGEIKLVQSDFGWHIIRLDEAAQTRGLDSQQFLQVASVQEAFAQTFMPWVEGLRTAADSEQRVQILVEPTALVPTPAPQPTGGALPPAAPPANEPPAAPAPQPTP